MNLMNKILVIAGFLLAGCAHEDLSDKEMSEPTEKAAPVIVTRNVNKRIDRCKRVTIFTDHLQNNTCYIVNNYCNYNNLSVSCVKNEVATQK
jgi:hypothetical protein